MLVRLLGPLVSRRLDAFERRFSYDVTYMRELWAASPRAFRAFAAIMRLSNHREETPLGALYAAKLAGTLAEDCGPCTQLVVTMAEREHVELAVLRAIVAGDMAALDVDWPDAALGLRFARAVLARAPELDELRAEVLKRWGQRALVTLGFAIVSSRTYPVLKYALGHGHACQSVRVGDASLVPGVTAAGRA